MLKKDARIALAIGLGLLIGRAVRGDDEPAREDPSPSYPVLAGIGVALEITEDGPKIVKVVPGSAAEKSAALHPGDRILSIRDGGKETALKRKTLGEVVSLIRGPVARPSRSGSRPGTAGLAAPWS